MPSIPFALQWTIHEIYLLPLKINGLSSDTVTSIPEFVYYLKFYPNGQKDSKSGHAKILLRLDFKKKNVKKVEVDYSLKVESAGYSRSGQYVYKQSVGLGKRLCKSEELFDAEKKYIVDGKLIIKINGTFKFEAADGIPAAMAEQKWKGGKLGDELWKSDGTKNFTIVSADGLEIKVHKFILAHQSEALNTMFDLSNGKVRKRKGEIADFSFKIVEAGIQMIYDCNFTTSLSLDELISLLQFFDKFDLPRLKAEVETYLSNQISSSNVVCLTNASLQTNSINLNEKCIEFLMASFESKTPIYLLSDLNKEIASNILQNYLSNADNDKEYIPRAGFLTQKWEGGELGDELWKNDGTKNFTIVTADGNEIKVHKFIVDVRSNLFNTIFTGNMKESNENNIEIIDFPFKIVKTAMKLIYNCNFTSFLSLDELILLQHFLDTYGFPSLKTKVEAFLISQISAKTVCRLTNASILTNSFKLKEKCTEFLMDSFESKTPLCEIKILNKDIALKILEDSLYQVVQTCE